MNILLANICNNSIKNIVKYQIAGYQNGEPIKASKLAAFHNTVVIDQYSQ